MLLLKFPLVATYIVVIFIDHHVFATIEVETCYELLRKEPNFTDDPNGGQQNFINAFASLSFKQINHQFKKPKDKEESDSERDERELRHKLTMEYFKALYVNHGIDVSTKKNVYDWCGSVVIHGSIISISKRIHDCIDYTTRLLQYYDDAVQPTTIFQRLYEDWTLDKITNLKFPRRNFDSEEERLRADRKMRKKVSAYSVEYFKYYQEVFDDLEPGQGNFKSIRQYCKEQGHILVNDSGYYVS